MELRLVQDLQYLSFPRLRNKAFRIDRGVVITTDKARVAEMLDRYFMPDLGRMLRYELLAQEAHVLFEGRFSQAAKMTHDQAKYLARLQLIRTQHVLQSLWLLRDNSGNAGPVFIAAHHDDGTNNWSHESFSSWYFTADCRLETLSFTHCDLQRALRLFVAVDRLTPRVPYETFQSRASGVVFPSRMARALFASQKARCANDVVVRITDYCIGFETLLSTDTAGVSHRVAERAANFIGGDAAEKRSIFNDVKRLYDVRSRYVHGGHVKPGEEAECFKQSVRADELLRRCLRKILRDRKLLVLFSADNQKQLQEYFLTSLFRN